MASNWNERYSDAAFAYGEEPNEFLKEQLSSLTPGTILFPAEGEGRNAVYAAKAGGDVSAFDLSDAGKKKALTLAEKNNVKIDYTIGTFPDVSYGQNQFDAIALIYAHFPAAVKSQYHKTLNGYLRHGGTIIFEAFSKNHPKYRRRNENVGGPVEIDMLFSIEEIKNDFSNFEVIEMRETEVHLREGKYHDGIGSVIRFVGRKK